MGIWAILNVNPILINDLNWCLRRRESFIFRWIWKEISQVFSIRFCSLNAFNLFFDDLGDSELEVAQFIKSSKNCAQLVDKLGYIYNKHQRNTDGTLIWWKCKEFQRNKTEIRCRARCTTKGFYITKKTNVHTHPPPLDN